MLCLASNTTGWMSEVSSRQRTWNNPLNRAESTRPLMWEKCVWLRTAQTLSTHSRGHRLIASAVVGVHNVLLQWCIFINVVEACVCVCVGDPCPTEQSRALLAQAQQRWRRAYRGAHSQPRFTVFFSLAAHFGYRSVYFQRGRLIRASSCQRFVSVPLLSQSCPLPCREAGASGKWTHWSQTALRQTIAPLPRHQLP